MFEQKRVCLAAAWHFVVVPVELMADLLVLVVGLAFTTF